jgi:hypothetical protein
LAVAADAYGPPAGIVAIDCPKGQLAAVGLMFDKPRSLQSGAFVSPAWTWREAFGVAQPNPFGLLATLDATTSSNFLWWNNNHYSTYWMAATEPYFGSNRWILLGDNTFSDTSQVLWPWEEPWFVRQPATASTDARVVLSGDLRRYPQSYIIQPGTYETCYRSDGKKVTLATANLYTGNTIDSCKNNGTC